MPVLLLAVAVLLFILLAGKRPRFLPRGTRGSRAVGGIAALAIGAVLAARGEAVLGVPLALFGIYCLGLLPSGSGRSARPVSCVRSAFVEMELDHRSGALRGRILADPHYGTSLDSLPVAKIATFLPLIDGESRALLVAYLDRREPGWRAHAQADAAAGRDAPPRGTKMTDQEAYQILGIEPGASAQEIGRVHRTLMKKLHPDQGGSTYLAARVNEAKDTLLRRHR